MSMHLFAELDVMMCLTSSLAVAIPDGSPDCAPGLVVRLARVVPCWHPAELSVQQGFVGRVGLIAVVDASCPIVTAAAVGVCFSSRPLLAPLGRG